VDGNLFDEENFLEAMQRSQTIQEPDMPL